MLHRDTQTRSRVMSRLFSVCVPPSAYQLTENDLLAIQVGFAELYRLFIPTLMRAPQDETSQLITLFDYVTQGATANNVTTLANIGFAEILATAFYFEENYLGENEIYLAIDRNNLIKIMRLNTAWSGYSLIYQFDPLYNSEKNIALRNRDEASVNSGKDIEYFPELIVANPRCWPTNGVACAEQDFLNNKHYPFSVTKAFIALQQNTLFVEKSYATFLELILTPHSVIQNTLSHYMCDPLLSIVSGYHTERRAQFIKKLLSSNKFIQYFFALPQDAVDALLQQCFARSANPTEVEFLWYHFLCQAITRKIKNSLEELLQLIVLCASDFPLPKLSHNAIALHTLLVAIHAFLKKQDYFAQANERDLLDHMTLLQDKIKYLLHVMRHSSISVNSIHNDSFLIFLKSIQSIHDRLQQFPHYFTETEFFNVERETHLDQFVQATSAQWSVLMEAWLNNIENKATLFYIYKNIYEAYFDSQRKLSGHFRASLSSAAQSGVTFFSSFLSTQSSNSAKQREPSFLVSHFNELEGKISNANTSEEIQMALMALFSYQGDDIETVHQQFLLTLTHQFIRDNLAVAMFAEENIAMIQGYNNTLKLLLNSDKPKEVTTLLMTNYLRKSPTVTERDDFLEISNNSLVRTVACALFDGSNTSQLKSMS